MCWLHLSDTGGGRSVWLPGSVPLQREESDSIEGRRGHQLESSPAGSLLSLWDRRWYGWWAARSRRRVHLGASVSRAGNPSTGQSL